MDPSVSLQPLLASFQQQQQQQQANLQILQRQQQPQQQQQHAVHQQQAQASPAARSYPNLSGPGRHAYVQQRQLPGYHLDRLPVSAVRTAQPNGQFIQPQVAAQQTYIPITSSLSHRSAPARQPMLQTSRATQQLAQRQHHFQRPVVTVAPVPQTKEICNISPAPAAPAAVPESTLAEPGPKSEGHLEGMQMIPDPPALHQWRQKLFNVEGVVVLSEDQFTTYFPHIDNVYSHRSTQRYKRKPFISHYWDCRLKGRPSGTPKSDDPNKRKRKRVARERDLCDVKIKITEYLPGATREEVAAHLGWDQQQQQQQPDVHMPQWHTIDRMLGASQDPWDAATAAIVGAGQSSNPRSATTKRFFTIQRVHGTGAGVSEHDGPASWHKHSLEDSDRIKKNSVVRWMAKNERAEKGKLNVKNPAKKTYHKKATGNALATVKQHSKEEPLKLYGGCFCPFVQRVWISLEHKGIPYQYIEVDPYKKPESLLAINPRGLIPALKHGDWGCYESSVLMEYLEDLNEGAHLLPRDPKLRATSRLWSDHINRHIVPTFYRYLQEQDADKQVKHAAELKAEIAKLVDAADPSGPFFLGNDISFVDIQVAPWALRLKRVLKPYRGWPDPEPGTRWAKWLQAIEENEAVKRTTSTDELYLDSYERYAENRPDTSQVANAVNSGRGLP